MRGLASRSSNRPISLGSHVMSRRRLARLVGVHPTYIGMIFSGSRRPSLDLAMKIAVVFDITVDELCKHLNTGELDNDNQQQEE